MTEGSRGHAEIIERIRDHSTDCSSWEFTENPHGTCLNKHNNRCLCGHRANTLYAHQLGDQYILVGIECMKKHFRIGTVTKNKINELKKLPSRWCLHCEHKIRSGVHKIQDYHYTCYIQGIVLPNTRDIIKKIDIESIRNMVEGNDKYDGIAKYNSMINLEKELVIRLSTAKKDKRWEYNETATLKKTTDAPQTKEFKRGIINQDLMNIQKDIILIGCNKLPVHSEFLKQSIDDNHNQAKEKHRVVEKTALCYIPFHEQHKLSGRTLEDLMSYQGTIDILAGYVRETSSSSEKKIIVTAATIMCNRQKARN
jgi:hypothetical protein